MKISMEKKNTGKEYERIVAAIHKQFAGNATITENEKIIGKSGRPRQIDVAIRSEVVGYQVLIIVQAKDYRRRVDIEKVDSLIGTLEDIKAAKGILVSDSGFTQGAIDRAKQDGRIELVAVVDIDNQKLKAKISIPTLAEIIGVVSMSIGISETSSLPFAIDVGFMNNAKNKFAQMWNKEELSSEVGDNEYIDVLTDTPEQKLTVTYHYIVERKLYFKAVGLEKGSGIFNVLDGSFRSRSITTERILMDDITTSWQEVTEENKPSVAFGFILYAGLPELNPTL